MNGFERRSAKKREQILQTALEIMNHPNGINNLTVQKIVEATAISKATIFKYFETKENLIQETFFYYLNQMKQKSEVILAKNKSFNETFMALTQLKVDTIAQTEQQFYLDLMRYYTQTSDQKLAQKMNDYTQESFGVMKKLLQQGRKEGAIDEKYSDEFLLLYTQAMVNGFSHPEIYQEALPFTEDWTEAVSYTKLKLLTKERGEIS
ncbi:TetR/AcrR family transcriptional regulator [Enterococcus cecorum]|uniref:TetR/AcrR family transcriptional regulator n=1 Tax=Enterococcus cecorum TaxID=44008 RepID=UPI001FABDDCD|nr:TetR/AcrR family transcriptional regulator [Enterococcus cecorum]MCJ0584524.1 TetR/AcrR family transcriptional regulator [Enterococcus cecorum]